VRENVIAKIAVDVGQSVAWNVLAAAVAAVRPPELAEPDDEALGISEKERCV
jgi:hypothetical protein